MVHPIAEKMAGNKMSEQFYFEFHEWQDAFATYYRKRCGESLIAENGEVLGFRKGNPKLVFVISTAPDTSGYWIEEGATSDKETKVYRGIKAVKALEARITRTRSRTNAVSLGKVVF